MNEVLLHSDLEESRKCATFGCYRIADYNSDICCFECSQDATCNHSFNCNIRQTPIGILETKIMLNKNLLDHYIRIRSLLNG